MSKHIDTIPLTRVERIAIVSNPKGLTLEEAMAAYPGRPPDIGINGGYYNGDWSPASHLKAGGVVLAAETWGDWGYAWDAGADIRMIQVPPGGSTPYANHITCKPLLAPWDGIDARLTIQSKLFRSDTGDTPGSAVPLESLERYAGLRPSMTLTEPCGLGMAYLKTPMENCVDGSEDGVAVYAPAVGLIRNINRNEQQINDEFDNGASRIIASADLLERDVYGNQRLIDKQFVALDDSADEVGITIFSPALREASYLARKTEYLRNIETQIGLKRGILSEVEAAERTARPTRPLRASRTWTSTPFARRRAIGRTSTSSPSENTPPRWPTWSLTGC